MGGASRLVYRAGTFDEDNPWAAGPALSAKWLNTATGAAEGVSLSPIGSTVLRRATFVRLE